MVTSGFARSSKEVKRGQPYLSTDGISFTDQSGPVIKGVLNDLTDEGCEFTFNASTRGLMRHGCLPKTGINKSKPWTW